MLFQMKFAEIMFKSRDAQHFSFSSYVKQKLYNLFSDTRCEPNWEVEKKRKSINDASVNLLDVFYLYKRVGFLEEAISILMEKHHLKGLHLIHSLTKEEADSRHKSHNFRNRVVFYLSKYRKAVGQDDNLRESKESLESDQYLIDHMSSKKMSEEGAGSGNPVVVS